MKILMTADTMGGVWTYALEAAAALAPYGVEVGLATMGRRLSAGQWLEAQNCGNLEIHESAYKLEWMENPWEDLQRAGDWLLRLEERLKPDVIHINGYCLASLPWRAPVVVVGRSCVLSWWAAVKGGALPASWNTCAQRVRAGLWDADLVVTPSAAMLAELMRLYGRLPRTRVIPNCRNPAMFQPWKAKQQIVLTAGRVWDQAENVEAMQRVAPALPWPVYIAGDAGHAAAEENCPQNVRRLGLLGADEMRRWFSRAAVYAHPARYEPFGLSALEAGLSGCALLLGDIPSLREVWGDSALFVAPDDPVALEAQLRRLIADEGLREMMAGRALSRALQYTPHRMAREYLAAYRQTIRRQQAIESAAISHEVPHPLRIGLAG